MVPSQTPHGCRVRSLIRPLRRSQRRLGALVASRGFHRGRLSSVLREADDVAPEVTLLCVYRARNVANVLSMCRADDEGNVSPRLWCLDGLVPSSLAPWTVGNGPGLRPALLNRLVTNAPSSSWIVVCDDDVRFGGRQDSVVDLVRTCEALDLDLAQPAHAWRSYFSHAMTVAHCLSIVRLTRFVEIGPLFVASPAATAAIFPLNEDLGMGLGQDLIWSRFLSSTLRMGILDAYQIRHLGPIAASYSVDHQLLASLTEDAGGLRSVMATTARWWVWQPRRSMRPGQPFARRAG